MYTQRKERHTDFHVKEEAPLFDFIVKKMGGMSKTAVKNILSKGQVSVDGKIVTQYYDWTLKPGDTVRIDFSKSGTGMKSSKISLIYEDEHLIVINKSEGLLSVETDRKEENTAFRIVMNHLKKQDKRNKLYIVHRLDRETSGVLLFAKDKETQELLQTNWQRFVDKKIYYTIVEGHMEEKSGTIHTWLNEDKKSKKVYSCDFDNGGMESITEYIVEKEYKNHTLLKINLKTGRKNQIRVHLQSIGHPIIGDKKYGGSTSPIGRVGLHASELTIFHPVTHKKISFEAPLPTKMANFK